MFKKIFWILLFIALTWPLLFFVGCRQRDGLVDVGSVLVDPAVLPDNFRCPMPPRSEGGR